uniref:cytochrome c oxidase subunit 2 n=1 Tax=Capsala martinieri TaxID=119074 RepID=UPI002008EBAB|nr:cytochrome c oxidase subunit 2 [Capsala martinieri]UOX29714.1 cytochrome c oxidase subunit 2 [Capsala martinieri]
MNLNSLYFNVVYYALGLCVFISFMVLSYLFWLMLVPCGASTISIPSENSYLEFFWTVIPSGLVLVLCVHNVSFILKDFEMPIHKTVKVIGRQWYWSYEYDDLNYDSYMTQVVNNVDKPLQMNYANSYRLLVTSSDVIHSFAVPDLGIKCDAIPGRINQVVCIPDYMGVFVGYCSELCGAGHSYMPIVVEIVKG